MQFATYTVIFDISQQSYDGWAISLLPLLLTIAAAFGSLVLNRRREKLAALFIGAMGIVGSAGLFYITWIQYERLNEALNRGDYSEVEGPVTSFRADQIDDVPQTFSVDGENFEIWGVRPQAAFHDTVGRGGPNLSQACVRILFTEHPATGDKEIIWLGVRSCA